MLLAHLKTLDAIQKFGSFSAAADQLNLSHSAVSIQMRQLEQHTGLEIFQKGKRPATLTPTGREFTGKAQEILIRVEELGDIGRHDSIVGSVSLGFVPTTLQTLVPIILGELRQTCPDLRVSVRSDLSGALADAVSEQSLDFAFMTAPTYAEPNLRIAALSDEPLAIISERSTRLPANPFDLFLAHGFVAFSRASWLGKSIETLLARADIPFEPRIELDSIDAVENLVAHGHGVSIVPVRVLAKPHPGLSYTKIPATLTPVRRLALASHQQNTRHRVHDIMRDLIIRLSDGQKKPA